MTGLSSIKAFISTRIRSRNLAEITHTRRTKTEGQVRAPTQDHQGVRAEATPDMRPRLL
jgi:hypothetical protein